MHLDCVLVKTSTDNNHDRQGDTQTIVPEAFTLHPADLIQRKKLDSQNFYESNLTEARFEII